MTEHYRNISKLISIFPPNYLRYIYFYVYIFILGKFSKWLWFMVFNATFNNISVIS